MKNLTVRRWLVVAWMAYLILTVGLFAIISLALWQFTSWHNGTGLEGPVNRVYILYPLAFIVSQLLIAGLVSWFAKKAVLKPLAAMSLAARQIARGDLNIAIPGSQVREVAEVAKAFEEMSKALQQALGRQAELEQERRFFISAVAHDLRTPLFSLRGYLQGLEEGIATTPEKVAHYLAVCRAKANDLEKRISDLFAYVRLEYMEQSARRETLDLNWLMGKVVESFKPQLEAKQIKLALENPAENCPLQGDEQLLTRLFENLLDNAVRYTPPNGTIWLKWHHENGRICFQIADNGPGIVPQDLPHLFEPLYRGEISRNRQTGGAGLGLSIARNILLAHGGNLEAANRPGGGAEFKGWL
jgi:signal transduction histidine kinase